jgi:hypothetical protein
MAGIGSDGLRAIIEMEVCFMPGFQKVLASLRRAERSAEKQLEGIRTAISSLEFGSSVSPSLPRRKTLRVNGRGRAPSKSR